MTRLLGVLHAQPIPLQTRLATARSLVPLDGSKFRNSRGRPRVDEEAERLVVRMAKENPGWGYDRIVGAMANLGLWLSDQTVGNILRRHDIPPAPKRKQATSWKDFIRLAACDLLIGCSKPSKRSTDPPAEVVRSAYC